MDVRARIANAFARTLEEDVANNIAFHMTDWEQDLDRILKLYQGSEEFSDEQIRMTIIQFLAHVPNHIAAAKKLVGLGPIEDVFRVGVLEEDDD
jgi:hypothetical protein